MLWRVQGASSRRRTAPTRVFQPFVTVYVPHTHTTTQAWVRLRFLPSFFLAWVYATLVPTREKKDAVAYNLTKSNSLAVQRR